MQKIISLALLSIIVYSCSDKQEYVADYYNIQGLAQGTTYSITYQDSLSRDFKSSVDSILNSIDASVSTYKSESIISKFNLTTDTLFFEVDDIFYQNLVLSSSVNQQTHGAFDPTVLPLYKYYKFETNDTIGLDSIKIDSLKNFVGIDKLEFKKTENKLFVRKRHPNLTLDFNAIAQGYSVDLLALFLESKGIKNYMIELGGEVLAKGKNPSNQLWRIAIEKPIDNVERGQSTQKIMELDNKALATSGSYRKYKELNGKKYSHAINPITGFPVTHSVLSVSVVANNCAEADAFATAFLVLGKEKSLALVNEKTLQLKGVFIETDDNGSFIETEF